MEILTRLHVNGSIWLCLSQTGQIEENLANNIIESQPNILNHIIQVLLV